LLNKHCLKWMENEDVVFVSKWAAKFTDTARGTLDLLKSGLELHMNFTAAVGGVGARPLLDQGALSLNSLAGN
jgi:hypothetical protein